MASVVEMMEHLAKVGGSVSAHVMANDLKMDLVAMMYQLDHQSQMCRLKRESKKNHDTPFYMMLNEGRRWLEKQKAEDENGAPH